VATLIANLQKDRATSKTSRLRKPRATASIKEMQAFLFTLTCEKGAAPSQCQRGDKSGARAKS